MLKFIRFFLLMISVVSLLFYMSSCNSCSNKPEKVKAKEEKEIQKKVPEIEKKVVDNFKLKILRYEQALFKLDPVNINQDLKKIQKDYYIFLEGNLNDPVKVVQIKSFINDPLIKETYKDINNVYKNLSYFDENLKLSLLRIKKTLDNFEIPKIYTYISGFIYEKPVIYLDTVMMIGLDCYLGKNYKIYSYYNIPAYTTEFMEKEYIVRDCIFAIGEDIVPQPKKNRSLLDLMVYRGKILYFTDLVLANTPDSIKIKYNTNQLEWCRKNEANVWAFFIEKNLLFSTDNNVVKKFMAEGPFTSAFSKNSPARIGEYIGWQIIRAYMKKNPKLTFNELIKIEDSQHILNASSYKPEK